MIDSKKVCLVAVDVRSAHNVGSFFRTCDGFGADLFLIGICPRPAHKGDTRLPHVSQKADKEIAKTALGAEKHVKWRYAESLVESISTLKNEGYKVVAIEQSPKSQSIKNLKIEGNTALIMGREVEGLSEEELAMCDAVYEIPMYGEKESFNVAVSAGIALYQSICK